MCNCVNHSMHVEVFVYHVLQMRFHHIVYSQFDMKTVSIISKQFNKIPVELPMIPQICISAHAMFGCVLATKPTYSDRRNFSSHP